MGISLVVPFRSPGIYDDREANFEWLRSYYRANLPAAEWIVGRTDSVPFNKSAAVNDGYRRASGDIIVILDADAFLDVNALTDAAAEIRDARRRGIPLWIMPYRRLYRLTQDAARMTKAFNPRWPWSDQFYGGAPADGVQYTEPMAIEYENHDSYDKGHMFGAMVQVHPREAFEATGGMDERFIGWGGEDISFVRAVDTLFGRHRSLNYPVMHLWHPQATADSTAWQTARAWDGQTSTEANEALAAKYFKAYNNYEEMKALVFQY